MKAYTHLIFAITACLASIAIATADASPSAEQIATELERLAERVRELAAPETLSPPELAWSEPLPASDESIPTARWRTVPFIEAGDTLEVSLFAFDPDGMREVRIYSGPRTSIAATLADDANRTPYGGLYVATIEAGQFVGDALHELRATATDALGNTRTLQGPVVRDETRSGEWSFFFNTPGDREFARVYVSPEGSDRTMTASREEPARTTARALQLAARQQGGADAGGATIVLMPGEHTLGPARLNEFGGWTGAQTTERRFVTVEAEPGAVVTGSGRGGLRVPLVRLSGLTFKVPRGNAYNTAVDRERHIVWFDACEIVGGGADGYDESEEVFQLIGSSSFRLGSLVFATDTTVRDAPAAFAGSPIMQVDGCRLEGIAANAFLNNVFVSNSTVEGLNRDGVPSGFDWHPHASLLYGPGDTIDNALIVGVEIADANALAFIWRTFDTLTHSAVVNFTQRSRSEQGASAQIAVPLVSDLLFYGVTLEGSGLLVRDDPNQQAGGGAFDGVDMRWSGVVFDSCAFGASRSAGPNGWPDGFGRSGVVVKEGE